MGSTTATRTRLHSGSQGTTGRTGTRPAEHAAPAPVVSGLVKGTTLPPVSGRGRKADPIPADVAADLAASAAGEGTVFFVAESDLDSKGKLTEGGKNAASKVSQRKLQVSKWLAEANAALKDGEKPFKPQYRTLEGEMPVKGTQGSDRIVIQYAIVRQTAE
jgi:hypothetical protein